MESTFTMDAQKQEKLGKLLQDEDFVKSIMKAGSLENSKSILTDNGVELTDDELREMMAEGKKLLEEQDMMNADGELSEKSLEMVAGGFSFSRFVVGLAIGVGSAYAACPEGVVFGALLILSSF